MTNNRTPLYGSPVFHEIYDEAQRLDVPLTIHGGVSQNLGLDRVRVFSKRTCSNIRSVYFCKSPT